MTKPKNRTPEQLQFQHEKTALKHFLLGRGFHRALKALGFVERYHVGLRKDGKTPELHHQVRICLSITQLKDLPPVIEHRLLIAALLHDVREDYQIPNEQIVEMFGEETAADVEALTKKFGMIHKSKEDYINTLAMMLVSSIVKGVDRNDNLESMIGVFTLQKMTAYADEAEKLFIPMLKKASKLYPEYMLTYQSIMQRMKRNIKTARDYVASQSQVQTWKDRAASLETQMDALKRRIDVENKKIEEKVKHLDSISDAVRVHLDELEALRKENAELKGRNTTIAGANGKTLREIARKHYDVAVSAVQNHGKELTTRQKVQLLSSIAAGLGMTTLELTEYRSDMINGDISTTSAS